MSDEKTPRQKVTRVRWDYEDAKWAFERRVQALVTSLLELGHHQAADLMSSLVDSSHAKAAWKNLHALELELERIEDQANEPGGA